MLGFLEFKGHRPSQCAIELSKACCILNEETVQVVEFFYAFRNILSVQCAQQDWSVHLALACRSKK